MEGGKAASNPPGTRGSRVVSRPSAANHYLGNCCLCYFTDRSLGIYVLAPTASAQPAGSVGLDAGTEEQVGCRGNVPGDRLFGDWEFFRCMAVSLGWLPRGRYRHVVC